MRHKLPISKMNCSFKG